jgi:hypothetical protein
MIIDSLSIQERLLMLNFPATCLVVILLACGHNFGSISSSQAACGRWPAFDDDVIQNSELQTGQNFQARDSLRVGDEASVDAVDCLRGLSWELADFDVTLEAPRRGYGKFLVRFPTPRPSGNARVDRVAMEWYPARDDDGMWKTAPAMVIVHESGKNMTVGRLIAKGVAGWGIHAFLLQMPGYGERVGEELASVVLEMRLLCCPPSSVLELACRAQVWVDSSLQPLVDWMTATIGTLFCWRAEICMKFFSAESETRLECATGCSSQA